MPNLKAMQKQFPHYQNTPICLAFNWPLAKRLSYNGLSPAQWIFTGFFTVGKGLSNPQFSKDTKLLGGERSLMRKALVVAR
ncbi:hypothetical protein TCAL_15469 [Tigriopus californicus]|uniref:Uncharacterized protein n=1 Tax=Tigriopus californicus TaxID=6832 RepID=A0A553PSX9_TIGCA|nr:hypothetical protein TCAL_15469 [Tigriopus californicus]